MKRKIILVVFAVLMLFLVLPLTAGYWVLYTNNGLRFTLSQLDRLKKIVVIEATGVDGAIAGGVRIAHLSIAHERVLILIDDLHFRVEPRALLLQTVLTDSASIGSVRVTLRPRVHPPTKVPLKFLPGFLRIVSNNATVSNAVVVLENHHEIDARSVHGTAVLTSHHLSVTGAHADGGFFTAIGSFEMGAADPITMSTDVTWTLQAGPREPWRGTLQASGDLNDLELRAEQHAPIAAQVTGRALDLLHAWHWETHITSGFIDFAKLNPAAKITASDIALDVTGDHAGIAVSGSLRPVSLPTGKLDIRAKGPYPTRKVQLDSVIINGSGGLRIDAAGVLNFIDTGPEIDLRGTAKDFRWPVVGKSVVASKFAAFSLQGPHLPYSLSL